MIRAVHRRRQGRRSLASFQKGHHTMRLIAAMTATAAMLLCAGATVAAFAKTAPIVYQSTGVSSTSPVTCKKTGITGPTGKVTVDIFTLKGKHPAKALLSCTRGVAVAKAFRKDFYAQLSKKAGAKKTVRGTNYELKKFLATGGAGFSPGMVGGGTVVVAQYASGR
jgi:hypothetical protein